jgi:hypothetical protein
MRPADPADYARTVTTGTASNMLRAQLSNANLKLSPMPAPIDHALSSTTTGPSQQGLTEAITEADLIQFNDDTSTHRREMSLPNPAPHANGVFYGEISSLRQLAAGPITNDHPQLVYETPAKSNRKVSDESTKSLPANHVIAVPMRSVQAPIITPVPIPPPSKADTDGNWRNRVVSNESARENVAPATVVSLPNPNTPFVKKVPSIAVTTPSARNGVTSSPQGGVMTMDELLAKFEGTVSYPVISRSDS